MGKIRLLIGLVLALAVPSAALAADSADMQNVILAKGEHRTGTFYTSGQTITVDGDVDGDVVCAGQTVVINGSVGGDVLCAAQNISINGQVGGSIRGFAQMFTVNGAVGRNVTVGAQNFTLGSSSSVSGEVAIAAQTINLNGPIAHSAYLAAGTMSLKSTIGGDLNYASKTTPTIDKSKVSGQVTRHALPSHEVAQPTPAQRLSMLLYWIVAALAGALLMIWLTPRLLRAVTGTMIRRWQASLGWGLLALIAGPALLFMLAITVIGLPSAGFLFVLWLLALIVSGLFAGIAIGQLMRGHGDTSRRGLMMAALVGVPVLVIVGWLPVLGAIVGFAGAAWAVGAMLLEANRMRSLG